MKSSSVSNKALLSDMKLRMEELKLKGSKEEAKKAKADYRKEYTRQQKLVDEYLVTYQQFKKLEKEMKDLRGDIEPFMLNNNIDTLPGKEENGRVEIVPTNRVSMSARYSTYSTDVVQVLDPDVAEACLTEVIDKEILEVMVKTGRADKKDVESYKMTSPSHNFATKFF